MRLKQPLSELPVRIISLLESTRLTNRSRSSTVSGRRARAQST